MAEKHAKSATRKTNSRSRHALRDAGSSKFEDAATYKRNSKTKAKSGVNANSELADSIATGLKQAIAYAKGKPAPGTILHKTVDVAAIRDRTGLSQSEFAKRFGLDVTAVQAWEQGRRAPERTARVLLQVIDSDPRAVIEALRRAS